MKKTFLTAQIAAAVFAVLFTALFFPRHSAGEEQDFFPRFVDVDGSLDFLFERRDTRRTTETLTLDTKQYQAIERIKIMTDGYLYDPRFMIFYLNGGFGFDQTYYRSNFIYKRASDLLDEYDLTLFFLPEHPYNLELYTRRQIPPMSPMSPEIVISNSRGALFRYKQSPLWFNLGVNWQQVENDSTVETTQYLANGTYSIGPFDNYAGYTETHSASPGFGEAEVTAADFTNTFKYRQSFVLASSVENLEQTQRRILGPDTDTETFSWSEMLSWQLPANLFANVSHNYQKSNVVQTGFNAYTADARYTTDGASLNHQLYNSLRTTAAINRSTLEATGGDTSSLIKLLSVAYEKMIPTGGMHAEYAYSDTEATRRGAAFIFNETHTAQVPGGTFFLNSLAINTSSINLQVKDPVNQGLVSMVRNVDYQVFQFGNQVQIMVLNLPAPVGPPVPSFTYTFVASYALLNNESSTDITSNGIALRFKLIEGFFNPYFSFTRTNMRVVTGVFFGGDDTTTTRIYGYTIQQDPFTLMFEYTDFDSRLNPYRNIRSSLEYRQAVLEDFDVMAQLLYNDMERPPQNGQSEYSDKNTHMQLTARKRFLPENLDLNVTGSYDVRNTTGVTSKTYTFYPVVIWHVGKLDVNFRMARSYTLSFSPSGRSTYETGDYFLTVSRKLF